jgi:hypothetical protein
MRPEEVTFANPQDHAGKWQVAGAALANKGLEPSGEWITSSLDGEFTQDHVGAELRTARQ